MHKWQLQRLLKGLSIVAACWMPAAGVVGASTGAQPEPTTTSGNVVVGGELQSKADAGDAKAAYALGMRYFMGDQIARNRTLAKHYLTRAAEAGELRAMNMLGLMSDPLWSDDASAKDLPTAVSWYRRAAVQGYEASMNNLSELKKRGYIKNEIENGLQMASGVGQAQPVAAEILSIVSNLQPVPTNSPNSNSMPVQPPPAQQTAVGVVSGSTVMGLTPTSHAQNSNNSMSGQSTLPQPSPMDGREMFKARSSSLVEILGDGNYGSGVILGSVWNRPEDSILRTALQDLHVNYPFIASPGSAGEAASLPAGSYLLIVSNAHVMEGTRHMEIGYGVDPRGQTLFKKPLAAVCFPTDSSVDLAIYFVPVEASELTLNGAISFAPLPPAAVVPETGSRVFAIANPERMARSIAQGLLNGLRPDLIQFDAPISKGSSGGAVFDDRGNLLGIIFGYLNETGAQNLNFAIPAERIRPLMMGAGALCYRAAQPEDAQPPAMPEKTPQRIR